MSNMYYKNITVRANGKAHPAIVDGSGHVIVSCRCPGSANGSLAAKAVKIADGHEKVTCRK